MFSIVSPVRSLIRPTVRSKSPSTFFRSSSVIWPQVFLMAPLSWSQRPSHFVLLPLAIALLLVWNSVRRRSRSRGAAFLRLFRASTVPCGPDRPLAPQLHHWTSYAGTNRELEPLAVTGTAPRREPYFDPVERSLSDGEHHSHHGPASKQGRTGGRQDHDG